MRPAFASAELSLLAEALGEAEDGLYGLPLTETVRALHVRLSALKTVSLGVARNVPKLTTLQRTRLVTDALCLARDVAELSRSSRTRRIR